MSGFRAKAVHSTADTAAEPGRAALSSDMRELLETTLFPAMIYAPTAIPHNGFRTTVWANTCGDPVPLQAGGEWIYDSGKVSAEATVPLDLAL